MKTCPRCKTSQPEDNFGWKSKAKGTRQSYCKSCNIEYNKKHYRSNKADYIAKAAVVKKTATEANLESLRAYLIEHHCVDCGEDDPLVLEFDHRVSSEKRFSISDLLRRGYSWKTILREIDKCDVRCANCHRKRTAKQFGWRKLLWDQGPLV